jgi:hypothetical protein
VRQDDDPAGLGVPIFVVRAAHGNEIEAVPLKATSDVAAVGEHALGSSFTEHNISAG